jgi:hypothetical protein
MQQLNDTPQISWRDLPGNKYNRGLHPAMTSPRGCKKTMLLAFAGKSKTPYTVHYDKEYAIAWLMTTVVKKLQPEGYQGICDLIAEAWERTTGKPAILSSVIPFSERPSKRELKEEAQGIEQDIAEDKIRLAHATGWGANDNEN